LVEPVDVVLQPEHVPVVRPDPLEHTVTVEEAVIKHGHLGFALVVKFSVNKNFHVNT